MGLSRDLCPTRFPKVGLSLAAERNLYSAVPRKVAGTRLHMRRDLGPLEYDKHYQVLANPSGLKPPQLSIVDLVGSLLAEVRSDWIGRGHNEA